MMKRRTKYIGVLALMASITTLLGISMSVDAMAGPTVHHIGHCQDVMLPATIPSGKVSIYGEFCMPPHGKPTTVQLLVHGATYNHAYWDFPDFNGKYSYVNTANAAGYATLAIDRLGAGQSSHPSSQLVTYDAEISVLHQIVQQLRTGIHGKEFSHVEMIGHSFGSAYTVGETSTYNDVDAVILTGYGHETSTLTRGQSSTFFYAANNEPRFKTLDSGYLTTKAGLRGHGGLFYDLDLVDPNVINADEATKDVVSSTEFSTRPANLGTLTPNIHVPVLIADGQEDTHYCGAGANDCTSTQTFLNDEAPYFTTCLGVMFVQSGHDINLHVTAPSTFLKLVAWSYATLPPYAHQTAHCAVSGAL